MRTLVQKLWIPESRKTILCIDAYEDGILQGRFYGPGREEISFQSLSQFLVRMEQMLEIANEPQSDTVHRSFSSLLPHTAAGFHRSSIRKTNQGWERVYPYMDLDVDELNDKL